MKEYPILFSGPMVRAIIEGRKTQTRRVIVPQPNSPNTFGISPIWGSGVPIFSDDKRLRDKFCIHAAFDENGQRVDRWLPCPYGKPGDRLWVRETMLVGDRGIDVGDFSYLADRTNVAKEEKRIPSIHMPRWASRLTLEIVKVRVEQVQDISNADALAEGVTLRGVTRYEDEPRLAFKELWDSINARRGYSWESNPWVWILEFKKL